MGLRATLPNHIPACRSEFWGPSVLPTADSNKLGLNWAKLSSNWNWALLSLRLIDDYQLPLHITEHFFHLLAYQLAYLHASVLPYCYIPISLPTQEVKLSCNNKQYQPCGEGGTRSPPATPHHLQTLKWPSGGPKMANGVWKGFTLGFWAF